MNVTPQAWPDRKTSYYTLFVLTVVVMFTVLDRQVLSLMIEPVKADFGISDTQVALLLGAAFSLTYAIAGLPIARIADRRNRRNLVAVCMAFWSAATMACGVAQSYAQIFLARLCIGIGESGYGPAVWSMVTDTFPREKVAFGTGTLSIGAMIGSGGALVVGGGALALVAHLPAMEVPLVGIIRPWQWAFIIVGAPGLVWALVVMSLKEPARRGIAKERAASVKVMDVARYMGADWRTYIAVIGGTAMKYLMTLGSSQWLPTLFRREFHWELPRIGLILGSSMILFSTLGLVAGGKLSERWTKQGRSDANLRIMLYGLLLSVPISVLYPLIPNPWVMLGVHAISLFTASLGTGPAVAAFQVITPNQMRAQVSSVSQFSTNVLAFALGPLIVALFTDYLFNDTGDLKYSMALSSGILGPLTILVVAQGLKPYARSYERTALELLMSTIESLEIIDAQIHEPKPVAPLTEEQQAHSTVFEVELAREAMDSVGVDIALAVTSEAFIQVAAERYPGRFPGVVTFNHNSADLAADAARVRNSTINVAGRALTGNWMDATLRPEFTAGKFDPLFVAAEKVGLPLFISTHGHCAVIGPVAERHPGLALIIDHIGIRQHPVSPPTSEPWKTFPDLLQLARYPNVHVKLCGAPLQSEQAYPFDDVWPQMARLFEAFGVDRVMWGSDYTRMRAADLPRGERPRKRGLPYADSMNFLLRSERLSFSDKKALFGGTARRVLRI